MPILSIGFVAYGRPRRPVYQECGSFNVYWEVFASIAAPWKVDARVYQNRVSAIWPRGDLMACGCDVNACVKPGSVCAPSGDDSAILFSVYDMDGDEFDLNGATEIVFAVADYAGGAVRFVKRLTDDEIVISTNGYQFIVYIDSEDSVMPVRKSNYYEVQVTTSDGLKRTVSAGSYIATPTIIKDLP